MHAHARQLYTHTMMTIKASTVATTKPTANRPPPTAGENEAAATVTFVSQSEQTLVAVTLLSLTVTKNGACLTSLSMMIEAVSEPSSFA